MSVLSLRYNPYFKAISLSLLLSFVFIAIAHPMAIILLGIPVVKAGKILLTAGGVVSLAVGAYKLVHQDLSELATKAANFRAEIDTLATRTIPQHQEKIRTKGKRYAKEMKALSAQITKRDRAKNIRLEINRLEKTNRTALINKYGPYYDKTRKKAFKDEGEASSAVRRLSGIAKATKAELDNHATQIANAGSRIKSLNGKLTKVNTKIRPLREKEKKKQEAVDLARANYNRVLIQYQAAVKALQDHRKLHAREGADHDT